VFPKKTLVGAEELSNSWDKVNFQNRSFQIKLFFLIKHFSKVENVSVLSTLEDSEMLVSEFFFFEVLKNRF
jgi:hypothetical protein